MALSLACQIDGDFPETLRQIMRRRSVAAHAFQEQQGSDSTLWHVAVQNDSNPRKQSVCETLVCCLPRLPWLHFASCSFALVDSIYHSLAGMQQRLQIHSHNQTPNSLTHMNYLRCSQSERR